MFVPAGDGSEGSSALAIYGDPSGKMLRLISKWVYSMRSGEKILVNFDFDGDSIVSIDEVSIQGIISRGHRKEWRGSS